MVTHFRSFSNEAASDPELAAAFATVSRRLMARDAQLDGDIRAALTPVKHTITVTASP